MHIPWGWIKQRPHFLAENLSKECVVDVWYRKANTVSKKLLLTSLDNELSNLHIRGFNQIPFAKIPLLKYLKLNWINSIIAHIQISSLKECDFVWIPCPLLYMTIKPLLHGQKVVYDCMDDMIEFPNIGEREKREIINAERNLLNDADFVFVSSEYLKNKILKRASILRKNVFVINNAIELPDTKQNVAFPCDVKEKLSYIQSLSYPLIYVGMISQWFDFDLIQKALDRYPHINIVLLGPCDTNIPQNDRIHYLGIVERTYIFALMKEAYALIMPFVLNKLILSVNPVKLYEYIYTNKPVIAVKYGETEKFKPFVNLYNSQAEFLSLIGKIIGYNNSPEIDIDAIENFVKQNTWKSRCKQIAEILGI